MEQREILFRGKREGSETWIYGSLITFKDGRTAILDDEKHEGWKFVIKETIGQFTGLTDKNGLRIFEGDILSIGSDDFGPILNGNKEVVKYQVIFNSCDYSLYRKDLNLTWGRLGRVEELNWSCEVIGNIHEA